jgi:hypothetical protein
MKRFLKGALGGTVAVLVGASSILGYNHFAVGSVVDRAISALLKLAPRRSASTRCPLRLSMPCA